MSHLSGGAAIEQLALSGDPHRYKFPHIMKTRRDCNFSFCGLQFHTKKLIEKLEDELGKWYQLHRFIHFNSASALCWVKNLVQLIFLEVAHLVLL